MGIAVDHEAVEHDLALTVAADKEQQARDEAVHKARQEKIERVLWEGAQRDATEALRQAEALAAEGEGHDPAAVVAAAILVGFGWVAEAIREADNGYNIARIADALEDDE